MRRSVFLIFLVLGMAFATGACRAPLAADSGAGPGTAAAEAEAETGAPLPDDAQAKPADAFRTANVHAEFKALHGKGKLVVGMYAEDRFPYFFLDKNGQLAGSDADMARDIARRLGLAEVEFDRSAQSFDELVDLVAAGKVDLGISKISITLNRAQKVLFSEPYLTLGQAVLVNRMQVAEMRKTRNEADPVMLLKANPVKIGVMAGTSYAEFAQALFPLAEVVPFDAKESMMEAARSGTVTAAFYDEVELKRYVNDRPDALIDLQFIVLEESRDYLAVAIPPENVRMQAWLKQYFAYREPLDIDGMIRQYGSLYGDRTH